MMDEWAIVRGIRKRVVAAAEIDPETRLKVLGSSFDPKNLSFWVEEHLVGGNLTRFSNHRSGCSAFMVQYYFYTAAGKSQREAELAAGKVTAEFDPADPEKSSVSVAGYEVELKKISVSRDQNSRNSAVIVLFSFEVVDHAG